MSETNYKDICKEDLETNNYSLLVVTATDIETKAFHTIMSGVVFRIICSDYTYYLGQVGLYNIIQVQCSQMGSISPGGSTQTINMALREWPQLKAVIMVGICFGVNSKKQHIGDVIVSLSIKNYETRRMGKNMEIPRGNTYQASSCLLNAFNNLKLTWENIGIDNEPKQLELGEFISGEQLVDNKDVRDKLLLESPEAKAGEMEGNGVVAACESNHLPWILVKAICDFADGNKGKDKKERQAIAAASSANCCAAALGQATAFESIKIYSTGKKYVTAKEEHSDVLFELYRKEYEPYYLKRDVDKLVESYLTSQSLWIYGISGVGKSTSISHALTSMNKNILLVNMAGISTTSTLEEIFEWIYYEVAGFVCEMAIAPRPYQLCFKKIISMLDSYYAGQEIYVLVEEIPFSGEIFKNFVASFSSLVVADKLSGQSADVHFVLSSIENPQPHVLNHQQKIKSMVKFLEFQNWTNDECIKLIELIRENLSVPQIQDSNTFISQCGNLPRPIKAVFRETYQLGMEKELDSNSISIILRQL